MIVQLSMRGIDGNVVLAIRQILHLDDRNLIQCIIRIAVIHDPGIFHCDILIIVLRCFRYRRSLLCLRCHTEFDPLAIYRIVYVGHIALCILVAVVSIDNIILIDLTLDLNHNSTGLVAGKADDIEAGAIEAEACSTADIDLFTIDHLLTNRHLPGCTQRVCGHIGISTVIAIDVIGVQSFLAELAGAVFRLDSILGFTNLPLDSCIRNDFTVSIISNSISQEGILVVDRGCRNDCHGGVVITLSTHQTGVVDRIDKGFFLVNTHLGLRITDLCVLVALFLDNLGFTEFAIYRGSVNVRFLICIQILQVLPQLSGGIFERRGKTHILQRTVITNQNIVAHDIDFHRQTVVDNHSVRHTLNTSSNRKPYSGIGSFKRTGLRLAVACDSDSLHTLNEGGLHSVFSAHGDLIVA